MENQNNYIQENESFEYIIKYISNSIFINIQNKISEYPLNIDIDCLKSTIYIEIREFSIQILVQDINDWRKSRKTDDQNYSHQYQEYCSIFFEKRYSKLLNKYKMLNKFLENYKSDLFVSVSNFLSNILNNEAEICSIFECKRNIKQIQFLKFVGDKHSSDRNIFFSIDNKKFYYKIHGMEVQKIASKINNKIFKNMYFKFPKSAIFENFMVQEDVKNNECNCKEDIQEYYYNTGATLFFIYLLNGIDFHNENIIADGKYPTLIDTETIINPISYSDIFNLGSSVYATGMLPMKYNKFYQSICDTSSIGQKNKITRKTFYIENPYTSKIKLKIKVLIEDDIVSFLPKFKEEHYDALNYLSYIIDGFENVYRLFLNNIYEYTQLINEINTIQTRFIFRNTIVYSELIKRLYAPDTMQNTCNTREFLNKFLYDILYVKDNQKLKYVTLEINQLLNGYIPYFQVCDIELPNQINQLNIKDTRNTLLIKESLIFKASKLSEEDLLFQKELICVSLNINDHNFKKIDIQLSNNIKDIVFKSIYNISDKKVILTLQKDWQGNYIYDCIKNGLYEGKIGLLLSDQELGKYFVYESIEKEIIKYKDIGLINGFSSLLLYHAYNSTLPYTTSIYPYPITDISQYDIIDGIAGYILLQYKIYKNDESLERKSHLINSIKQFVEGDIVEEKYGFAHGISGIKIIYMIGFLLTKDMYYLEEYEAFEKLDHEEKYLNGAWCNGLTGYLISQYILYKLTTEQKYLLKIKNNLNKLFTFAYSIDDYCLCHGVFGILDFLLTLKQNNILTLKYENMFNNLEQDVFNTFNEKKILVKDISLFTGVSGIQYYINRKQQNKNSILSLCF